MSGDTNRHLLIRLADAEACIMRAQEELGARHETWWTLDDYGDGSMDAVKHVVAAVLSELGVTAKETVVSAAVDRLFDRDYNKIRFDVLRETDRQLGEVYDTLERYVSGTGQRLWVHREADCMGECCVIHNRRPGHMHDWPTHWRFDRRIMELICPHGVRHPAPEDLNPGKTHGCDGCCQEPA